MGFAERDSHLLTQKSWDWGWQRAQMERDCLQQIQTAAELPMATSRPGTVLFCSALFFDDLHNVLKVSNWMQSQQFCPKQSRWLPHKRGWLQRHLDGAACQIAFIFGWFQSALKRHLAFGTSHGDGKHCFRIACSVALLHAFCPMTLQRPSHKLQWLLPGAS